MGFAGARGVGAPTLQRVNGEAKAVGGAEQESLAHDDLETGRVCERRWKGPIDDRGVEEASEGSWQTRQEAPRRHARKDAARKLERRVEHASRSPFAGAKRDQIGVERRSKISPQGSGAIEHQSQIQQADGRSPGGRELTDGRMQAAVDDGILGREHERVCAEPGPGDCSLEDRGVVDGKALGLDEGLVKIELQRAFELALVKIRMVENRVAGILAPVAKRLEFAQRGWQLSPGNEQIDIPHAARTRAGVDELGQRHAFQRDGGNRGERVEGEPQRCSPPHRLSQTRGVGRSPALPETSRNVLLGRYRREPRLRQGTFEPMDAGNLAELLEIKPGRKRERLAEKVRDGLPGESRIVRHRGSSVPEMARRVRESRGAQRLTLRLA